MWFGISAACIKSSNVEEKMRAFKIIIYYYEIKRVSMTHTHKLAHMLGNLSRTLSTELGAE